MPVPRLVERLVAATASLVPVTNPVMTQTDKMAMGVTVRANKKTYFCIITSKAVSKITAALELALMEVITV